MIVFLTIAVSVFLGYYIGSNINRKHTFVWTNADSYKRDRHFDKLLSWSSNLASEKEVKVFHLMGYEEGYLNALEDVNKELRK